MTAARVVGVILVALGALALAYGGFSYTKKEEIIDLGPIQATAETREHTSVPVWVGGLMVAGGLVLLVAGGGRRAGG